MNHLCVVGILLEITFCISINEVIQAIKEQNEQYAAGKLASEPLKSAEMFTYTLESPSRLSDPKAFGEITLRSSVGTNALRLKDVANIELGSQSYDMKTKLNNAPAVPMGLFLQSGANAMQTAAEVRKVMERISKDFESDVEYIIPYDITDFVEISIKEVIKTFIEAMLLVTLIIYLFLQNFRATLIPLFAVPVSIIGAFMGIYALGFSINLLTLFGLVLAIGIVVDDAIIVIENVERHMAEGLSPLDATLLAMKEVSGALVAIVLVLCAVFLPVAFLGGLSGEMYRNLPSPSSYRRGYRVLWRLHLPLHSAPSYSSQNTRSQNTSLNGSTTFSPLLHAATRVRLSSPSDIACSRFYSSVRSSMRPTAHLKHFRAVLSQPKTKEPSSPLATTHPESRYHAPMRSQRRSIISSQKTPPTSLTSSSSWEWTL